MSMTINFSAGNRNAAGLANAMQIQHEISRRGLEHVRNISADGLQIHFTFTVFGATDELTEVAEIARGLVPAGQAV